MSMIPWVPGKDTSERGKHLDWCKQRALEYLERGDLKNAWASFASDMGKHPETANHIALPLGFMYVTHAMELRHFI